MNKTINEIAGEKYPYPTDAEKEAMHWNIAAIAYWEVDCDQQRAAYIAAYQELCLPMVDENKRLRDALEKIAQSHPDGNPINLINQAKAALLNVAKGDVDAASYEDIHGVLWSVGVGAGKIESVLKELNKKFTILNK
jgi:hypothetical protein